MIEIGKLYNCQKYYLLIYPTAKMASDTVNQLGNRVAGRSSSAFSAPALSDTDFSALAYHWSKKLNCNVRFSRLGEIFMVVERKQIDNQILFKVLCKDKLGWVVWKNFMHFEKVSTENV